MLQADARYDLVIAGSFLLTDDVVQIARANPATHFVLVDPLVIPTGPANLQVLVFRDDQAAFLAGALAGLVTQTGVVAGVYGPEGTGDKNNRLGFEHAPATSGTTYARSAPTSQLRMASRMPTPPGVRRRHRRSAAREPT